MIVDAAQLIAFATATVVVLLGAVVALKLFNGTIGLKGMLVSAPGGPVQPDRLLLLGLTVAGAFAYLTYGLAHGVSDGALPDIPEDVRSELLTFLGGGNLYYLVRKYTFERGPP